MNGFTSGKIIRLATLDEIGHLDAPAGVLENYRNDFISTINPDIIRKSGLKVVIDYANGGASQVFPTIFSQLGINVIALNAYLDPRQFSSHPDEMAESIVQLSAIVRSLHADIGFHINPAAEKLTVVDENGNLIDSQLLLLLVTGSFPAVASVAPHRSPGLRLDGRRENRCQIWSGGPSGS